MKSKEVMLLSIESVTKIGDYLKNFKKGKLNKYVK